MAHLTEKEMLELIEMTEKQIDDLDYETSMQRLETVVEALEQEGTPLETGLKLYEVGTALSKKCGAALDAAEEGMLQLLGDIKSKREANFDPEKDGR